ncbi:MAG: DUF1385 domain-containing protein [Deltaproteobacteria bacterium]|jgi:uncharacterized protein YqhQ|nr:DUF1385 domain-containing protein [Deltaproteobacteria bacterium]
MAGLPGSSAAPRPRRRSWLSLPALAQESLAVGGQAVMEGIMMRNGDRLALAVRQADAGITAVNLPWVSLFHGTLARRKWVRGFPILVETLVNGIKALNLSAELAAEAEGEKLKPWQIALTLAVAVGLALLLFVVAPHLLTILMGFLSIAGAVEGLSFHLWDGLFKFALFIGYIALISTLPDIRRVFEYHGAEHKTIAALEHGEDPVSAQAAAKYSRLHPRCGTTFLLFVLSLSILLHAVALPLLLIFWRPENPFLKHGLILLFKLLLMVPISALAYEGIRYAARMDNRRIGRVLSAPGLLLQRLTTREPDRAQLEVGLVALREALGDTDAPAILTPAYTLRETS